MNKPNRRGAKLTTTTITVTVNGRGFGKAEAARKAAEQRKRKP